MQYPREHRLTHEPGDRTSYIVFIGGKAVSVQRSIDNPAPSCFWSSLLSGGARPVSVMPKSSEAAHPDKAHGQAQHPESSQQEAAASSFLITAEDLSKLNQVRLAIAPDALFDPRSQRARPPKLNAAV